MSEPAGRLDHDRYLEARSHWVGVQSDQAKFIDQTVLTLAAGALGLSLTFLRGIKSAPRLEWLLFVGGALMILSIALVVVSLHTSQRSISEYVEALDSAALAGFKSTSIEFLESKFVNQPARATQSLNSFASFVLLLGLGALSLFASANLGS